MNKVVLHKLKETNSFPMSYASQSYKCYVIKKKEELNGPDDIIFSLKSWLQSHMKHEICPLSMATYYITRSAHRRANSKAGGAATAMLCVLWFESRYIMARANTTPFPFVRFAIRNTSIPWRRRRRTRLFIILFDILA